MADRRYHLAGLLLLGMVARVCAATPTEAYLAARDRAIASIADDGTAVTKASEEKENSFLATLEPMVKALVGSINLKGFPFTGKANVDALSGGTDFGKLDGIAVTSTDGKTELIVSTIPLLDAWSKITYPNGLTAAGQPSDFITQAIRNDARAEVAALIPVIGRSPGDTAAAALFLFAQDIVGSNLPNKIAVTVTHQGRVFLFVQKVSVAQIPACKAAFDRDNKLAAAALDMGQDDSDRFGHCFARSAMLQPWFKRITTQAQALVDVVSHPVGHSP